jgi:hypothetical protein
MNAIEYIEDCQVASTLLRLTSSFCKIVHFLRGVPPIFIIDILSRFDQQLHHTFEKCVGLSLGNTQWVQASLSLSKGGLGLRSAVKHAASAYISSVSFSALEDGWDMTRAVGWSESFAEFNNQVTEVNQLDNVCVTVPWRQKELSKLVEEADFIGLLSSHKIRDQARLRALTCKGASAWLNAIPSFHMRQVFPNAQYVILLRLWLGLDVYDSEFPCPTCGNHMDVSGFHALTCKSGGYLGVRHNSLRDEFFRTCRAAQLAPKRETPFLLADSQDRPADVFLPSFSLGRPLCLDFAITHPLQKNFFKRCKWE